MEDEVRVAITTDADLVTARAEGRAMAERLAGYRDADGSDSNGDVAT